MSSDVGMSGRGAGAGKIAGAPISWGVCEVPGWGYQLSPERVLAEMTQVGLAATELGPAGFLPNDPRRAASVLREHHLASVGGFVPVVLHVPGHDPAPEIQDVLAGYAGTGSGTLVLSADSGLTGYDARPTLDEDGWATLLRNLDRLGHHQLLRRVHRRIGHSLRRWLRRRRRWRCRWPAPGKDPLQSRPHRRREPRWQCQWNRFRDRGGKLRNVRQRLGHWRFHLRR